MDQQFLLLAIMEMDCLFLLYSGIQIFTFQKRKKYSEDYDCLVFLNFKSERSGEGSTFRERLISSCIKIIQAFSFSMTLAHRAGMKCHFI